MSEVISTQGLSLGYGLDLTPPATGFVHSVFHTAVNGIVNGEMWTFLAEPKRDLPFGIRMARRGFEGLTIRRGDAIHVRAGYIAIDSIEARFVIDCRSAKQWTPFYAPAFTPGTSRRLETVLSLARERAWRGAFDLARVVSANLRDPVMLSRALAKTIGTGPGATPSGDDVLIGILAVLASPYSGETGSLCLRTLAKGISPLLANTTDVSAHLLQQAMRGFVSRDLSELLVVLASDPSSPSLQLALNRIVETGATSGADCCIGLATAAPSFFISQSERAAA